MAQGSLRGVVTASMPSILVGTPAKRWRSFRDYGKVAKGNVFLCSIVHIEQLFEYSNLSTLLV